MNDVILKYCEKEELTELYDVYNKIYNNTIFKLEHLEYYFNNVPKSVLIGKVNNKIVSHLFCHPMNIDAYENAINWVNPKYYNPNGKYLYFWGAGILPEYRTKYNLASSSMITQVDCNINTYKNIEKSILYVDYNNKRLHNWHYLMGYNVVHIINNVKLSDKITHYCVMELDLKSHLQENGYSLMKKYYGHVNSGIEPKFIKE